MADKNLRLQIILEGLDRITAPLKSITSASSNARRDLAKTHDELKSLDALQKQVGSYKAKQSGLATNTKAYHEQQGKLAAMQMQLEATAKPTKKLRDEFARAERQVAQLGNQLDKGRADLQQLSGKLSEAGIDVKALAVDEERLARKVGAANFALEQQTAQLYKVNRAQANSQKLSDISGKATGAGLGMIAAGTATALPITMAVKQAMTLESGMADVNKVANMTSSQIEQLSNDFLDMSEKIPMAANEFPAIAAAAASAGVGIAPLLTNLDGLKQRLALVGDQSGIAGSMHQEFLTRVSNTEGATTIAGNALTNLNTTMGDALLPTVKEAAEKVTELASAFRGWAQENPALAKGLMIFLAVGAGLLIMVGGLALAFGALTAAAAPLGIALGPLLLIVAAIAAVAAAAYYIYANWGGITAWFSGLWETIKSAVGSALSWIIGAFFSFSPLGLFIRAFSAVLTYFKSLNFGQIGRNIIQGLINGITGMLGKLKSTVLDVASSVTNWFKQKLDINSPSRVFAGLGGFVMEGLDQGLAANTSGPLQRITDLSGQMTRALAVGAGGVAIAAASPAGASARTGGSTAALSAPNIYNITINANGNAQSQDIEEIVIRAIERADRERQARGFIDGGN